MELNCRTISHNEVITVKGVLNHIHNAVGYQLKTPSELPTEVLEMVAKYRKVPIEVLSRYRLRTVDEYGNCNEDCFQSPFLYRTMKLWFETMSRALELKDKDWEWACKRWNKWGLP